MCAFHCGAGTTPEFAWGQAEESEGGMMAGAAEAEISSNASMAWAVTEVLWEFQRSLPGVKLYHTRYMS